MYFIRSLLFLLLITLTVDADSERIEWLQKEIERHDRLYWEELSPEISDPEYDQLVAELHQLQADAPQPARAPDFTDDQRESTSNSTRQPHRIPMLSLQKLHDSSDWQAFHERMVDHRQDGDVAYRIEPKLDGVAINLVYTRGRLRHALTRGDGHTGSTVTAALRLTTQIPESLEDPEPPAYIEIRGELYVDAAAFAAINDLRQAAGDSPYSHPRHLVAATLRLQDMEQVAARELSFCAFDARMPDRDPFPTQTACIEQLNQWGFDTPQPAWKGVLPTKVTGIIQQFGDARRSLDYPTDGLVLKVESRDLQLELGATQRAPRWAAAWKYPGPARETRILEIIESVGKTGRVTPVARVETVHIDGIRIENISLHSPDYTKALGAQPGARVKVHLAGGVIPAILRILED